MDNEQTPPIRPTSQNSPPATSSKVGGSVVCSDQSRNQSKSPAGESGGRAPAPLAGVSMTAHRQQVLDEARACGRMGASRLSDTVLFGDGFDPTQTLILQALEAFEEGKKERGTAESIERGP